MPILLEEDQAELTEPRTNVYVALDYYFKNLNLGRPYFLAGHSQGSRLYYMVLTNLQFNMCQFNNLSLSDFYLLSGFKSSVR